MCDSCARREAAPAASRSTPQPETTATQRVYDLIGGLLSEGEVKAEQQAAAPHGGSGGERRTDAVPGLRQIPDRFRERVLAVQRQPGAAEHERVAADPEREPVNVALVTGRRRVRLLGQDRKSTRLNSSHGYISYAVFCLEKKK